MLFISINVVNVYRRGLFIRSGSKLSAEETNKLRVTMWMGLKLSHRIQSVFERPIVVKNASPCSVDIGTCRENWFVCVDANTSQSTLKFSVLSVQYLLSSWVERIKCLAQGHNAVSPCHEKTFFYGNMRTIQ